jgi:hypothetical protein
MIAVEPRRMNEMRVVVCMLCDMIAKVRWTWRTGSYGEGKDAPGAMKLKVVWSEGEGWPEKISRLRACFKYSGSATKVCGAWMWACG